MTRARVLYVLADLLLVGHLLDEVERSQQLDRFIKRHGLEYGVVVVQEGFLILPRLFFCAPLQLGSEQRICFAPHVLRMRHLGIAQHFLNEIAVKLACRVQDGRRAARGLHAHERVPRGLHVGLCSTPIRCRDRRAVRPFALSLDAGACADHADEFVGKRVEREEPAREPLLELPIRSLKIDGK
eukprot:CAMPEP_0206121690 /NCGR_PEP_ID=MMETSP1472-20131121/1604_1 /ASSEMBLY_ACC=CAM_ASM_001108 /TAXON_ID=41880 /ORGANISM="Pycnococcus provasolii, Strain RCC251" /LENGTH=183 /DNA_ID=CAMNT_0053512079 /DNA_START=448 /DNA_END=999 /DNA_ORIENTATION=+